MIKKLMINDPTAAKEIWNLQQASYQIEADLIGFQELPPLKESIEDVMALNEEFFGYYMDGLLAGAISIEKEDSDSMTICRMMVHPDFHRKGIASSLLDEVFTNTTIEQWKVTTGAANMPAKNLYIKHGFREVKEFEVVPGLMISAFERKS